MTDRLLGEVELGLKFLYELGTLVLIGCVVGIAALGARLFGDTEPTDIEVVEDE